MGVLSAADLVQWVDRGSRAAKRRNRTPACVCCDWQMDGLEDVPEDAVSRYMTTDVVTAALDMRLGDVARSMRDAHIHRIVVVNERCQPVGVVSTMDVLAAIARLEFLPEVDEF